MINREAYIYFVSFNVSDLLKLEDKMNLLGFSLYKPNTSLVTSILDEQDIETADQLVGDDIEVTYEWLVDRVQHKTTTVIQWWANDWRDIFFRIRFYDNVAELMFDLGSVANTHLEQAFIDMFTNLFIDALKKHLAIGLVVDMDGNNEGFQWSELFLQELHFLGSMPKVLAIPFQKLGQIITDTKNTKKEINGEFIFFTSR